MSRSKHSYHGVIKKSRKNQQQVQQFRCVNCKRMIDVNAPGTRHRNHCPLCLWSSHVDEKPGDRAASCRGKMQPVAVWVRDKGEWALVHRCTRCETLKSNRIAGDDNEFVLLSLAAKAIASPPFPLQFFEN